MVKIDDQEINRLENNDPRSFENVRIYAGDYFNDPANARLGNLEYESQEGKYKYPKMSPNLLKHL